MKWFWKWTLRSVAVLFTLVAALFLFVKVRSMIPVPVHDAGLQLDRTTIPAQSNAFYALETAAAKMWWPDEEVQNFLSELSATNWDEALAVEVLKTNQAALADWDASAKLTAFQVPEFNMGDNMDYLFGGWKKLSSLSITRARHLVHIGQTDAAFQSLLAHASLGHKMENAHGVIIHYLVGHSVSSQALACMRESLTATNLNPMQLKACAEQLDLLTKDENDCFANTIKCEYQTTLQVLDDMRHGKITDQETGQPIVRAHRFNLAINYSKTKALFADAAQTMVNDASCYYNDAKFPDTSHPPTMVPLILSGNFAGEVMYFMMVPAWSGVVAKKARADVEFQATRTLLALRAFQLTYGKLPENIAALVPEFLDRVPVDDFNGQPLHYSATDKMVYSVGQNLKDDGGDDRSQEEWNSSQRHLDIVFPINF